MNVRHDCEQALAGIVDPSGEGQRAVLTVYDEPARAAADHAAARIKAGNGRGPLDGVVVTIKDLFDVAGEVTRAGSRVLVKHGAPAARDAPIVKRLREAGAVIVGKTNMTEFAYSGIGTNPHFSTPGNPADRRRIPGGSSSGAAVSVADGFCRIAIGSDTGGSARIPAALCGIVGFKPTAKRVPRGGAYPLSFTLDSIGPLAMSVADCADADAVMAGADPEPLVAAALRSMRFGVLRGLVLDHVDGIVGPAFENALTALGRVALCRDISLDLLDAMVQINARGGIAPAEAFAVNRGLLAADGEGIDPNVRARLVRGGEISASDYILNMRDRAAAVERIGTVFDNFDVLVLPTTPIVAPMMAEVDTAEGFAARNALLLRNPSIANFFDLCAISLPIRLGNALPCGLMLFGSHGDDRKLLQIAAAVHKLLG